MKNKDWIIAGILLWLLLRKLPQGYSTITIGPDYAPVPSSDPAIIPPPHADPIWTPPDVAPSDGM